MDDDIKTKVTAFLKALDYASRLSQRDSWAGNYVRGNVEAAQERHRAWMRVTETRADLIQACGLDPVTLGTHTQGALVSELRARTGCGTMHAKEALMHTGWDLDKALEYTQRG